MKSAEGFTPDDSGEWLNLTRSDMALAVYHSSGEYLEDSCFPTPSRLRPRQKSGDDCKRKSLHLEGF